MVTRGRVPSPTMSNARLRFLVWMLDTPSKVASKIHWYHCMVWGVKVTVAKACERLAIHILLGSTSKMSMMRAVALLETGLTTMVTSQAIFPTLLILNRALA